VPSAILIELDHDSTPSVIGNLLARLTTHAITQDRPLVCWSGRPLQADFGHSTWHLRTLALSKGSRAREPCS